MLTVALHACSAEAESGVSQGTFKQRWRGMAVRKNQVNLKSVNSLRCVNEKRPAWKLLHCSVYHIWMLSEIVKRTASLLVELRAKALYSQPVRHLRAQFEWCQLKKSQK